METLLTWILDTVNHGGYLGVYIALTLVFSLFPFPSQVVLIPAGYLAHEGELELWKIIAAGSAGGVTGAFFNYTLASRLGRRFFLRYGRYLFIAPESLLKIERFFRRYGSFSVFAGLISPAIGQLVTLPAGLARMPLRSFSLAVFAGAVTWNSMMVLLGYFSGQYRQWLMGHLHLITIALLGIVGLMVVFYVYRQRHPGSFRIGRRIGRGVIALYRFFSALMPGKCRYYPTCSEYALWQLDHRSLPSAAWHSALRILRCNQLFPGGIDSPTCRFSPPPLLCLHPFPPEKIRYWLVPAQGDRCYIIRRFPSKEL